MNRKCVLSVLLLITFATTGCRTVEKFSISKEKFEEKWDIVTTAEDTKIIFDADVMFINDDTYALFELLKADEMGYADLLGITAAGGNTLSVASAYDAINQLDYVGRSDVPVYVGYDIPLDGLKDIDDLQVSIGRMDYVGAYQYINNYTTDFSQVKKLGISHSSLPEPSRTPDTSMDAVDFIIKSVHQYPGKVTIVAIGGLTNIAMALEKDPTIVEDAAGIFYMGGVFDVYGEFLPKLELNWWYDPKAANKCLSAGWKKQITISHDAALTCLKGYDMYLMFKDKKGSPYNNLFYENLAPIYENGREELLNVCWDAMVPACLLCPSLIESMEVRETWVDDRPGKTYGSTFGWKSGRGPEGTNPIDVIFKVNRDAFWEFVTDLYAVGRKF